MRVVTQVVALYYGPDQAGLETIGGLIDRVVLREPLPTTLDPFRLVFQLEYESEETPRQFDWTVRVVPPEGDSFETPPEHHVVEGVPKGTRMQATLTPHIVEFGIQHAGRYEFYLMIGGEEAALAKLDIATLESDPDATWGVQPGKPRSGWPRPIR